MKKLYLILLLLVGCKHKEPVFHIKAEYWYDCQWSVSFTNDDFHSEENIMDCWDASDHPPYEVVHQLKAFPSEDDAVDFAKNFTSYKKCIAWNDSIAAVAKQLKKYRKANPVEKLYNEQECKDDEGKEIIIY